MRILVIGSGGREHALVWKLSQSLRTDRIYAAPGNPGISRLATCEPSVSAEDIPGLLELAKREHIDLTIVGPEAPLVAGIVDEFQKKGLSILGPTQRAAALEGSKVFAKEILTRYGIPTANHAVFANFGPARDYIRQAQLPLVIKADGLAAGKGVIMAPDHASALQAAEDMLIRGKFGGAGAAILVEEFLEGEEVSILGFADGETVVPLIAAQDHKRIFDDDQGPNTGGMGAYAPAPLVDARLAERIRREILEPTVLGMQKEGRPYRGILYAGLMITRAGPKVLEYNCRFGDPETQAILPLLEGDLVELCLASASGTLRGQEPAWKPGAAVCVVLASRGYPGAYEKGIEITGLEDLDQEKDVVAFHSGTTLTTGIRGQACLPAGRDQGSGVSRPQGQFPVTGCQSPANTRTPDRGSGIGDTEREEAGIEEEPEAGEPAPENWQLATGNWQLITAGGRVLGITGIGKTLPEAIERTYKAVSQVHFEGMHYRKDIGAKALKTAGAST